MLVLCARGGDSLLVLMLGAGWRCLCWRCELAVHVVDDGCRLRTWWCRCGCGAVSWLCTWWRQVAGAGAGAGCRVLVPVL